MAQRTTQATCATKSQKESAVQFLNKASALDDMYDSYNDVDVSFLLFFLLFLFLPKGSSV